MNTAFLKQHRKINVILVVATCLMCYLIYHYVEVILRNIQTTYQHQSTTLSFSDKKIRTSDVNTGTPYLIPNDDVLQKLNETELLLIYWRYINTIQSLCRNQSRMGEFRDGGKEVCLDEKYKPTKPCIVYSFGSNFKFDFDVMVNHAFGCEVFTYDPTMNIEGKTLPSEVKFVSVGLSRRNYRTKQNWEMKTLKTILKDNRHENKVIDIVKMDIEGSEWPAISNIIESGVYRQIKQFEIEVHFGHRFSRPNLPYWGDVDLVKQLRALRMLYESGFRIFMKERVKANMMKLDAPPHEMITTQNEISLINMAFY